MINAPLNPERFIEFYQSIQSIAQKLSFAQELLDQHDQASLYEAGFLSTDDIRFFTDEIERLIPLMRRG